MSHRQSAPSVFRSEAISVLFHTPETGVGSKKHAREAGAETEEGRDSKRVTAKQATEERRTCPTDEPSAQLECTPQQEPERDRSFSPLPDEQSTPVEERESTPVSPESSPLQNPQLPQAYGITVSAEPYDLLHDHGIVVCTECCIGVEPTEIASHLLESITRSLERWLRTLLGESMSGPTKDPLKRLCGQRNQCLR